MPINGENIYEGLSIQKEKSPKSIKDICNWIDEHYPNIEKMVEQAQKNKPENIKIIVEIYLPLIRAYALYIKYPSINSKYGISAYKLYKLFIGNRKLSYGLIKWYFQEFENIEYDEIVNDLVILFIEKIIMKYKPMGSFRGYFFYFFPYAIGDWVRPKLKKLMHNRILNYDIQEELELNRIDKSFLMKNTEVPSAKVKLLFINDNFVINPKTKFEKSFTSFERNLINMRFQHDMTIKDIVDFLGRNRPEIEKHFKNIARKLINYFDKCKKKGESIVISEQLIEKKRNKLNK